MLLRPARCPVRAWIAARNTGPGSYVWTKTADEIPERLAGCPNGIPDSEDRHSSCGSLFLPARTTFSILSGELEFHNGEKWVTGRVGDFLYVPVGGLHAFKNVTDEPMSMLMLFSPGAPREEYFERVADMARRGGEELKQFRIRHDSYFLEDREPGKE